jgi:hypothetical protein
VVVKMIQKCEHCGSTNTRYVSDDGYYTCLSCNANWGLDKDDPDYDENLEVPETCPHVGEKDDILNANAPYAVALEFYGSDYSVGIMKAYLLCPRCNHDMWNDDDLHWPWCSNPRCRNAWGNDQETMDYYFAECRRVEYQNWLKQG